MRKHDLHKTYILKITGYPPRFSIQINERGRIMITKEGMYINTLFLPPLPDYIPL